MTNAEPATKAPGVTAPLLSGLLYFAAVSLLSDFAHRFEFDPDESNNLLKALCLNHGFALGADIWTDQPPLYTYLLGGLFRVTGPSVAAARYLSLAFASLIVTSVFGLLDRWSGRTAAIAGCLLLLGTKFFVPLSVAVMIGLPALAFAFLALWLLELGRAQAFPAEVPSTATNRGTLAFVGAGVCLGLSLGTKLFAAFLLPVFAVALLVPLLRRRFRRLAHLVPLGAFLGAALLTTLLCLAPLLRHGHLSGLVEAHATSRELARGSFDGAKTVGAFLREDWPVFVLALGALPLAVRRRSFGVLIGAGWLLAGIAGLLDHYPVWTHHRLLLTLPGALLAGFSVGELLEWGTTPVARRLVGAPRVARAIPLFGALVVSLAPLVGLTPERITEARKPRTWTNEKRDLQIVEKLRPYAKEGDFWLASRPMFAFHFGHPVPPNLAVTSWKRFRTGLLSAKTIRDDVRRFRPAVIVLSNRWPSSVRRRVRDEIKKTYRKAESFSHQDTEIWVREEGDSLPQRSPASTR